MNTRPNRSPVAGSKARPRTTSASPLRPILLKRLHLRCGDWSVRELRVNRHLQPFDQESPHRHAHSQLLLYLRGRGEQRIGRGSYPVGPGAVFFIPRGTEHAFLEKAPRLAICLVADLGGAGPTSFGRAVGWLPAEEIARVRERLNQLAHEHTESRQHAASLELDAGGITLMLLESCRRACLSPKKARDAGDNVTKRLLRSVGRGELPPTPGELARRVGLQKDYLNRLMKRSTGLTLGQWRAKELLKASERELSQGGSIGGVAMKLGFADANYFSRWFRRQTGMPPLTWRSRS